MRQESLELNERRKHRTRTRTDIVRDKKGRTERVKQRNRVLVARWYFWTECKRLRADDAITRLCDEFFVESRTVTNAILQEDDFFRELLASKANKCDLGKIHNSFNWG